MPQTIIYARIKSVREAIQQKGVTVNEELILECGKQSASELGSYFLYMIGDTEPFDLEAIETANPALSNRSDLSWFVQLNNELAELMFWAKTNPTQENRARLEAFKEVKLPEIRKRRFESPPAQTRT